MKKQFITALFFSALSFFACSLKKENATKSAEKEVQNEDASFSKSEQTEKVIEEKSEDSVFFNGEKVLDTLFVLDVNGANITLEPDEKSVVIASVPFNFPLKTLEITQSAHTKYAKVSVPRYLRSDGKDEGFVPLSALCAQANPLLSLPEGFRAKNLHDYLLGAQWKKQDAFEFLIFDDGTFRRYRQGEEERIDGQWRTLGGGKIEMCENGEKKSVSVEILSSTSAKIDGVVFESKFSIDSLSSEILDTPRAYQKDNNGYTLLEYAYLLGADFQFVDALIASGVSAGISPYHEQYDEFWSEKKEVKSAIKLDWTDLGELWAESFEYLFQGQDIDADGKNEGLYFCKDNKRVALVKNSEAKCVFLDFGDENPKKDSCSFEFFMPYNLEKSAPFLRLCDGKNDTLFEICDNGVMKKVFSLEAKDEQQGAFRRILFSENSIIVVDFQTQYGCILSDNVLTFPR